MGLSELLDHAVPMLDLKYHSGHFFLVTKDQEAEGNQSKAVIIKSPRQRADIWS